ncbi:MAG: peptidase S8 [Ideonella sp. MAG2]|nr:MAG: peptidase S8 [Ideonella sp. MAG2]
MQYPSHTVLSHLQRFGLASALSLCSLAALAAPQSGIRYQEAEPSDLELRSNTLVRASSVSASTDRLVIRYRNANTRAQAYSAAQVSSASHASLFRAGLQAVAVHHSANGAQVLTLDRRRSLASLQATAAQLMADDPNILYAEPDFILQRQAAPSDPYYNLQWHYHEVSGGLRLPTAWDLSVGTGINVAVIDTGVRPHADLVANLLPGADMISTASVAQDGDGRDMDATDVGDGCNGSRSSWHGTHVAGTIAAVANNGIGGVGVAPGAKIVPVRALGCGGGYNSDIADGIAWAAGAAVPGVSNNQNPARVINLSLGGMSSCSATLQTAIDTARSRGAVVIVAAGNSNASANNFSPANCRGVITVAATTRAGGKAPYSNTGTVVDVAAPGGSMNTRSADGVLSTLNTGTTTAGSDSYQYYQGTSMATPHVAGAAALLLARRPTLLPYETETLIRSMVRAFPAACASCGTGIVDATALTKAAFVSTNANVSNVTEVEPNNTHATAQAVTATTARILSNVGPLKDLDIYKVTLPVGATLVARLIPQQDANIDLEARTLAGTLLVTGSNLGAGRVDTLSYANKGKAALDVYLRATWKSGGTGDVNGAYTLELAR